MYHITSSIIINLYYLVYYLIYIITLALFYGRIGSVKVHQLKVTYLPSSFFSGSSNTSVVQGSVIWLYCEVNSISSNLSVTWNKDGGQLVQDVPDIRLRTSNTSSSTTLLLVIDNVVSTDAGVYQCTANDGPDSVCGVNFTMTGS